MEERAVTEILAILCGIVAAWALIRMRRDETREEER